MNSPNQTNVVLATTISQLDPAKPLTGSEVTVIVQNGKTVKSPFTVAAARIITSISGSLTVNPTDVIIEIAQTIPSSVTVNLPLNPIIGLIQTIKDGAGVASIDRITLVPQNGALIDGQGYFQMNSNWQAVSYYWNGSAFRIVTS